MKIRMAQSIFSRPSRRAGPLKPKELEAPSVHLYGSYLSLDCNVWWYVKELPRLYNTSGIPTITLPILLFLSKNGSKWT